MNFCAGGTSPKDFWPAIHFGDLEVRIGDLEISSENLAFLLEESQKDEITAHYYYEAFTSSQNTLERSSDSAGT